MKIPFVSIAGGVLGLAYVWLTAPAPAHQAAPASERPAYTIQSLTDGTRATIVPRSTAHPKAVQIGPARGGA